jgi:hypothetical protein
MKYAFLIVLNFSYLLSIHADVWSYLANYTMNDEAGNVPESIHDLINDASVEEMILIEKRLIAILNDNNSTHDSKEYSLRMLSRMGSEMSISAIIKHLNDDRLALHARSCLEKHSDSLAAEQALLGALTQVKDHLKIGIIASLEKRYTQEIGESILFCTKSNNAALADFTNQTVCKYRENNTCSESLNDLYQYGDNNKKLSVDTKLSTDNYINSNELLDSIAKIPKQQDKQRFIRHVMEVGTPHQRNFLVSNIQSAPQPDQMTILGAIHDFKLYQYENAVLDLLNHCSNDVLNQSIYTLGVIGKERSFQRLYAAYQENNKASLIHAISQLQLPAVDKHLLSIVRDDNETNSMESRIAAMLPLALRNPKGTASVLDPLISRDQPEPMRMAALKAIEYAGGIKNCIHLCNLLATSDPLKRQIQLTLKRTALRLDKSNEIWNEAFKPILVNDNINIEDKKSLIAVIDGVPGIDTIEYLTALIINQDTSLRRLAIRALQRWPNHLAGNLWIQIASADDATNSEIKLALKGITRILSRKEIEKDTNRRLMLALSAIVNAPNEGYKIEILRSLEKSDKYAKKRMKVHFLPIIDDPHIGEIVRSLMGSV